MSDFENAPLPNRPRYKSVRSESSMAKIRGDRASCPGAAEPSSWNPSERPLVITDVLWLIAPLVEAFGNYHDARKSRVFDISRYNESDLLEMIPRSRGGKRNDCDAEREWQKTVQFGLTRRGATMHEINAGLRQLLGRRA